MISARLATLHELDTVYGLEDLYTLGEILIVDGLNREIRQEWEQDQQSR